MMTNCAPMPVKLNPLLALYLPLRRAYVGVIVHVDRSRKRQSPVLKLFRQELDQKAMPMALEYRTLPANIRGHKKALRSIVVLAELFTTSSIPRSAMIATDKIVTKATP